MKKQNNRGGIGTLAALSGGFIGLSFNSLDTIFGKIMIGVGIILLVLLIVKIIRTSK